MGRKTECLTTLLDRHINVHDFKEVFEYEELLAYVLENKMVTIRFDRYGDVACLPFYVISVADYEDNELKSLLQDICESARTQQCSMLCSNGLKCDHLLLFNFVGTIDGDFFEIEFCTKQVPLRQMYEYPITIVQGRLQDHCSNFVFRGSSDNHIDCKDLEYVLSWLISLGYQKRMIEASYYQVPVGVYQQRVICWQII